MLQAMYDEFTTGWWANPDAEKCLCRGHGWALSDLDTWHKCRYHYIGQCHPEEAMDGECNQDCRNCIPFKGIARFLQWIVAREYSYLMPEQQAEDNIPF